MASLSEAITSFNSSRRPCFSHKGEPSLPGFGYSYSENIRLGVMSKYQENSPPDCSVIVFCIYQLLPKSKKFSGFENKEIML